MMLKDLVRRGTPIHGVGIQMHIRNDKLTKPCAGLHRPHPTGGVNKDDSYHHCVTNVSLWRSHCEAGIGRARPI